MEKYNLLDKLVSLCKRRGFIYPGSEIYGGLGGTWDYGPVGSLLKKNLKDWWWEDMVTLRDDIVGLDAAIMMNPKAWEASGHTKAFSDPLVECKNCHKRFRADHVEELYEEIGSRNAGNSQLDGLSDKQKEMLVCEKSNDRKHNFTEPKNFNLLVKAYLGIIEGEQSELFLRGEITNGVQVNFKNVVDSTRIKIPFGIAQIGKAFRNEITPGNFTFRSREFEQMEVQFYVKPDEAEGMKWFEYWKQNRMDWYIKLGMEASKLRFLDHTPEKRAHYAKAATDIEYLAPWGWAEFMGIHHRADWDLSRHQEFSGVDMTYMDTETNEKYVPWDIETSAGVDRSLLFLLLNAYSEDGDRVVLKLHPRLAPYKVAVFPLVRNKEDITAKAREVYDLLKLKFKLSTIFDDRGNIGKRYLAQDEIGTPWCVTIDYQTLEDGTVTVRDRDTTRQERVGIDNLGEYFGSKLT